MHSSPFFLSIITFIFAFLIVRVTSIPTVSSRQVANDGNLFSSSNSLLDDFPSLYTATGIEAAPEGQSFGPIALASANDLLQQSISDDTTGTGISPGMDQLWDTNTGTGTIGEESLNSFNDNFDIGNFINNNNHNNNFNLLASSAKEPYTGPDIGLGGFDDSRTDATANCPVETYTKPACCGMPISADGIVLDCLPSKF